MARLIATSSAVAVAGTAVLGAESSSTPSGVSPGSPNRFARAAGACPTFSWGGVDGALGYELVVFRVGSEGIAEGARPALEASIRAAALSWTPAAERCLPPGRYAWSVRGSGGEWSEALLFEVAPSPGAGTGTGPGPPLRRRAASG